MPRMQEAGKEEPLGIVAIAQSWNTGLNAECPAQAVSLASSVQGVQVKRAAKQPGPPLPVTAG